MSIENVLRDKGQNIENVPTSEKIILGTKIGTKSIVNRKCP